MADALLGVAFENLLSLVQNEFATISGIKGKAEKLSRTLELIKTVVEDAEEKQITNGPIKVWLQQLKDAVYVLDDILDECSIESLRLGGLSSFKPKNIKFRYEIGKRLKEITSRFDEIADSRNKFVLREGVRERPTDVAEWRQTSSIIPQPEVYGRQDDKEKIVEFFLSQASRSDFLSVYPIVGLGGMGKTTLSQMVYNDDRVRSNFEIKVWICVSENFSVKRIFASIIESITREKCDALDLDVIEGKVQDLLQCKRYLLVLDDVWKRNQEMELGLSLDKWNQLKSVLSCASRGASILVSTRDMDVAAIMGTCQAHHLCGLSEDECWMLFKQYAFGPDNEEREELVAIGKEIVKKCGGSPLAAQALGGLLRSRNEESEWFEVKESSLWNIPDENSILATLRLSYFHLMPTLRQCFSFCAMFPKDTRIMKKELIYLWIANEFISSRENLEVEDVGNMIWKELYQKSFFQDMEVDGYSGDISFKMHDLVHDLAQSVTGQECMTLEYDNITDFSRSTHHITIGYVFSLNKGAFKKAESLRTLYELEHYYTAECSSFFPTHRSLRVLRASSLNLSSLKKLIHLRYLELYELEIKTLPNSIYSLRKLKILKLIRLRKLMCLPKHLACLQDLRHLIIEGCVSLSSMCSNIGNLSYLRTLSTYIVSSKIGHSLSELHDLKLTGNLSIVDLQYVDSLSEAQEANLKAKKDLDVLNLSWVNRDKMKSYSTNPELLLEALQPHSNLKKLKIVQYQGLEFPRWISMLSNLVDLQLCGSEKCVQLSSLGRLPCLKKLEMWWMSNVQYIDDDESYDGVEVRAFPSLEILILGWLPKLERLLKMEIGEMYMFPHLSGLMIKDCPKLVLPCIPSLKSLTLTVSTNELTWPVSSLSALTYLTLYGHEGLTYSAEGLLRNLNCLRTLNLYEFRELKELPYELFNLNTLECLHINSWDELECLPEQGWEGLRSLRTLEIYYCRRLRSLPDGVRHLTSLQVLKIGGCPALQERCKEGTGEDWDKIRHVPKMEIA